MGIKACRCTGRPCFSSSYSKQVSYALSRRTGPRAVWTFIADAMIASPISFSVILRVLRVKAFLSFREELADFGEELARAERLGDIAIAAGGARFRFVAGQRVGGHRN